MKRLAAYLAHLTLEAKLIIAAGVLLTFGTVEAVAWQHASHLSLAVASLIWGAAIVVTLLLEG